MNNKSIKSKKMLFSLLALGVLFASAFIVKCSTTKPDDAMQPYFMTVAYQSKKIAYSEDGLNWLETNMPAGGDELYPDQWRSICYGKDKFVAVGGGNLLPAYSTNGLDWSNGKIPDIGENWYLMSVCYSKEKDMFVAVGAVDGKSIVIYSTNGIDWKKVVLDEDEDYNLCTVCYGKGMFVTFSKNYSYKTEDYSLVAYSKNGREWIIEKPGAIQPPTVANTWNGICYGKDKFVAVSGSNDHDKAVYSPNGETWTPTDMPSAVHWNSVCYGESKDMFVAVGAYSVESKNRPIAAYSTDGTSWSYIATSPLSNAYNWRSVCYGNDKFVAVSYDNSGEVSAGKIAVSNDGINWEVVPEAVAPSAGRLSVCFGYVDAEELKRRLF